MYCKKENRKKKKSVCENIYIYLNIDCIGQGFDNIYIELDCKVKVKCFVDVDYCVYKNKVFL